MIKTKIFLSIFLSLILFMTGCAPTAHAPDGFVYVNQIIPTVHYDIRYNSPDNFVGSRIDGYITSTAILTTEAALALQAVSTELDSQGYYLKIFDGYRPQKAVDHFIRWGEDLSDTQMKAKYYPHIDKKDLFALGYIAKRSGHSRGSTVDLTLVKKQTGQEVDMGSSFDYLDPISTHGTNLITAEQASNRDLLKNAMQKHGFNSYSREWWHYTLINEPFPDQYFDFDVK